MLGTVIFSVWPHLRTWGPSPSFVAFIWAFRIARALKGFHTATNTLSKLAELSLHLRCKTRSKGKKERTTNYSTQMAAQKRRFDYRRERKETLLSWFLQKFNGTWYFSCIFAPLVWTSVWQTWKKALPRAWAENFICNSGWTTLCTSSFEYLNASCTAISRWKPIVTS